MRAAQIKRGKVYETNVGFGICTDISKRIPPAFGLIIAHPFPRGKVLVTPRDVIGEVIDEDSVKQVKEAVTTMGMELPDVD